MAEDILDHWLRIVKTLFPANAWIVGQISKGNHVIQIDWRLESDPDLPQKRSRKIEITIREDVIDDYLDKSKAEQAVSDLNMRNWISEQYRSFDPEPDPKTHRAVPIDRWRVSKDVLG